ncbi:YY1-associated factor 2 [Brachionus plicatilis]|uniref:YY1-associated factor 2 n=1 Tax=Brachionus plicatilis TaxID=10195 RepID=A0A3M7SCG4_BRAPC|nr:YY1-associated factor 2 [Brachionus plicatilis]
MDNRKAKRSRSTTAADDAFWDCPLCTYRNKNESFRCEMCNMRKGTSTRKPRISQVTQQLATIENQIEQERKKEKRKEILLKSKGNRKYPKHFKFDNAQTISITVNDVTVFITDVELNSHDNEEEACKSLSTKSSRSKLEVDSKDSADNTTSSDNDSSKNEAEPVANTND